MPFWTCWRWVVLCDYADEKFQAMPHFAAAFFGLHTMTFLLVLVIGISILAVGTALVRGLMAFVRDAEHIRANPDVSRELYGLKQNRMMTQRVLFQGIAIFLVVILGALASAS